ncbi:N-acetylmuramoyl-L-alanine amidase [Sediminivirga luteola]|uniref:N-acetylmuramoyl-L-alanine amidase n=1 Tax=Sediminivirga luteola TaxID=1774748 RepID=A0A8J2TX78_9MICO|nr:N-acetylmuramoyl-L-alanine amidase [Sediminivirga luteola]GGA10587.1 hypothetical protein GCM10011333_11730 [Sediminivirga luteola]
MPYLTDLVTIARRTGYPVREVQGWRTRGRSAMSATSSLMVHHTASAAGRNAPSLNVVTHGRVGLPGPLCHYLLARDGTIYVVAAGRANHAGTVSATRYTNPRSIGIEAENNGVGEPWTAQQMDAYAKLCRAIADHYRIPIGDVVGHKEAARPLGRKIDPTFSMPAFRDRVRTISLTTPNPSTPAKPKGLFGMTVIATGRNTTERTINPGEEARIAVGEYFSMCTLTRGSTVRPTVNLGIVGAHEEDRLMVRAVIVDYLPNGTPQDRIVGNFYPADVKGTTDGSWTDHVYVGQPYHVTQTPRSGGSLRLQLLARNRGQNPITIRTTDYTVESD